MNKRITFWTQLFFPSHFRKGINNILTPENPLGEFIDKTISLGIYIDTTALDYSIQEEITTCSECELDLICSCSLCSCCSVCTQRCTCPRATKDVDRKMEEILGFGDENYRWVRVSTSFPWLRIGKHMLVLLNWNLFYGKPWKKAQIWRVILLEVSLNLIGI